MADLRQLDRRILPAAEYLVWLGRRAGFDIVITSVRRSRLKQAQLRKRYEEGLSPFPAAKPGCSVHEHGLAFDLVVRKPGGGTDWEAVAVLGRTWESWGGVWGGRWKASDPVHFQPSGIPPRLC